MDSAQRKRLSAALLKVIESQELTGSPDFYKIAVDSIVLHSHKNEDYASQNRFDGFDNFIETAAQTQTSVRQVFRVMQGIKKSRYESLLASGAQPNNESLADTVHDMGVYYMLEAAFERRFGQLINTELTSLPADLNADNILQYFGLTE